MNSFCCRWLLVATRIEIKWFTNRKLKFIYDQMMEGELTCPGCLDLFKRPVVLPCSHNLCTSCAKRILEPRGISKDWVNWVVQNKPSSSTKSHLQPDVKCPTCRQRFLADPRGVAALQRNLILENVIERFKEERTTTKGSHYDQEPLLCQFCEDFLPQNATCMCSECTFTYCGACFDTYHPMKGPLSSHTIGPPEIKTVKGKENIVTCQEHKEKVALYCHECQTAVCYLCKEFGEHKKHSVELLEAVFRKTKDDMQKVLGHLMKHNNNTQKLMESLEGMCAAAKKSGSDVESHVKKEFDMLLAIIEKKKAKLLENINSAYNDKLAELHEAIHRCDKTLQQSLGLVEFSEEALKENNPATFMQNSSALKTRLRLMLDAIKDLPQISSFNPTFEHMAVDTSWERKMLKKLDWLQEPGSPSFVASECKAQNRSIYLIWSQPPSAVDAYHLHAEVTNPPLVPGGDELRQIVQVNTATDTRYVIECSRYNAEVVARVKASNRAGDGPFSRELTMKAGKGLDFKLDPSSSPHRELVFSRDLTIAKLTNPVSCVVLGDISLTTGRHYWKVRVDHFQGATKYSGYVAVGVATTNLQESLLGDHGGSYGLQVFENPTMWTENTHNRLQIIQKSKEIKGSNFAVLLDLDERIMNIYLNGKLQTDQTRPKGPSFVGITGTFYPALCLYGTSVQTSIQSGIQVPTKCPGIPIISLEDCSVDNTKINLVWTPPDDCNVDCYILEANIINRKGDIHQERMFAKVYQGPRCKYTIRGLEYNNTVVARVIAVNTAGQSEPSDEVSLSTERGVIFKLDAESIHEALQLSRGDKTVAQQATTHANVFGDALLADGCHYWIVELQQLNPKNCFIAVGVTRKLTQEVILGNDTSSYALQIFTETGARTENTKNRIQLKKKASDIKGSIFGVLLDLNKEMLNIYLDGELQKTSTSPKGPSFTGLTGMFCAGLCLYGTNVKMSLTTGIETPPPPDAPAFNKVICKVTNTTVYFGWHSPASKCPIDYYILEVDVVKATEFVNKMKKDRKFKRVYEGPLLEHSIFSVAYDMKVIGRVFGVNMAGEGLPSNDLVLSTPKGLYFTLDPTTANHELDISQDHCTVALKSPTYTFILGNAKLTTGCHYWRVHIDVFNSPNQLTIIGVGVAGGILDDPILGEDSHSYAVQFNEHPTTTCVNTKNRIQIKKTSKEMTNSNIGVLLNLDGRLLNIFFNGKLLTDNSRPSGPTFTGISGDFYPALSLYGTNVQLTVHTGESFETK